MIDTRQELEGWDSGVIFRLAAELKNEMPKLKRGQGRKFL